MQRKVTAKLSLYRLKQLCRRIKVRFISDNVVYLLAIPERWCLIILRSSADCGA